MCHTGLVKRPAAVVLLIAAVTAAAAGATQPKSPLDGVYRVTISGNAAQLNGTWLISFAPNGAYAVVKEPNTTQLLIGGTSTTRRGTVTMTDKTGPAKCTGRTATARYRYSLSNGGLRLTKVKDLCGPRTVILASTGLTKVR
jgi:hypothetical protein